MTPTRDALMDAPRGRCTTRAAKTAASASWTWGSSRTSATDEHGHVRVDLGPHHRVVPIGRRGLDRMMTDEARRGSPVSTTWRCRVVFDPVWTMDRLSDRAARAKLEMDLTPLIPLPGVNDCC